MSNYNLAILMTMLCLVDADKKIDFIRQHFESPARLNALTCWNKDLNVELVKALSSSGMAVSIQSGCVLDNLHHHHSAFVLDANCAHAEACLQKASSLSLLGRGRKWIMLTGHNGGEYGGKLPGSRRQIGREIHILGDQEVPPWMGMLSGLNVLVDSDFTVAEDDGDGYRLWQVYKRRANLPIVIEDYGYWQSGVGIIGEPPNRVVSTRRLDLNGTVITASIVILDEDTLNHLTDGRNPRVDLITKVNYAITHCLMDFVNATKNFTFVRTWGYVMKNGSVNGMVGQMVSGIADIGGTPLFFNPTRMALIEFISKTTPTANRFIFRQPPLSYVSNIFLLPFAWSVWAGIGVLVVVASICMYFIARNDQKNMQAILCEHCNIQTQDSIPGRWSDVCMVALGAVAQQGSSKELRSISGRITIILLFITVMFLYGSYSANIVSLLQSQSVSIKTINDLYYSGIKLGAEDNPYSRYYFASYNDTLRKAIYEQKMHTKNKSHFYPPEVGIARLNKGLFAFHAETGTAYKIISETFREEEKCGLSEIKFFDQTDAWYTIPMNSSFREMFKVGMRRIQETGIQSREVQKFYTKKPTCSNRGGFVSVGLVEVKPALVWLSSGAGLSLIIWIIEKLINMMCTKRPVII